MKLAVMQPYFFPYLGYWQLLNAVDRFVIYDDVNYIKKGWINRNRILINGVPSYITIPLVKASQNKRICDISIDSSLAWRSKLVRTIEYSYRKAPFFLEVFPIVQKMIHYETDSLSDFLAYNITTMATFIGIKTEVVVTSRSYQNNNIAGQERILDICKREGATTYINLQGGRGLYDTATFSNTNIDLCFIKLHPIPYKQRSDGFVPYLSVIDTLMEIGAVEIAYQMNE